MVDCRIFDNKGFTICPQCKVHYIPVLGERPEGDNRCIQNIFPESTPEQREQLITGLCSTKCWNKYLGVKVDDE